MEAREDEEHLASMVAKRKRTKLPRSYQRLPSLAESATLAASAEADISDSVTEEDEYMAKCLILLSRGRSPCAGNPSEETAPHVDEGGDRTDGNFAGRGSDAACVYECKTCSKCFSSFQALGGHRASHKKLKLAAAAEDKRGLIQEYKSPQISNSGYLSMQIPSIEKSNTRKKMHECTICGSEFSSGQALGGHMRRHRLSSAVLCPETQDREKRESNLLSLDLNLPAPTGDEEEHNGHSQPPFPPPPAFTFVGDRPFIFGSSASALVVCQNLSVH